MTDVYYALYIDNKVIGIFRGKRNIDKYCGILSHFNIRYAIEEFLINKISKPYQDMAYEYYDSLYKNGVTSVSMQTEISGESWKNIPGFSKYEISEYGRIRSFHGRKNEKFKILKGSKDKDGYRRVSIVSDSGKMHSFKFYEMVAKLWIGERPKNLVITHLDGNKLNDHYSNLAYRSQLENIRDKIKHGTQTIGENHPNAKLTNSEVSHIKNLISLGHTNTELSKEFNIAAEQISAIRHNKTWKHIPWPNEQKTI